MMSYIIILPIRYAHYSEENRKKFKTYVNYSIIASILCTD